MSKQVKIIAGKWRSRVLTFPDLPGLRPTPARIRETLFNWLQFDIAGKHCLDLYAGSGALGFEAGSRGAAKVVQVEHSALAFQALIKNQSKLAAEVITITQQDALEFLKNKAETYDLVFLDPPFADELISQTCLLLEQFDCLNDNAIIYIESERSKAIIALPENWQCLKQKQAGQVSYQLFSRIS